MANVVANIRLAVRADTTDPVELWLVRLRPGARHRFLTLLYTFLEYAGYDPLSVASVLEAARNSPWAMHETVKAYIATCPDCSDERMFAYSGLRSFFSRAGVFMPTDPYYDPGGKTEQWWVKHA